MATISHNAATNVSCVTAGETVDKFLFGQAIKEARQAKQLTQTQLAERTGLTVNALSLIENGHRFVSIQSLNMIALALDVHPAMLVLRGSK